VTVTAGTPNGGTAYDGVYNWTFNSGGGDARCGQFANGDYWVAPAVGQTTVTVTAVTSTSPGTLRVDADPTTESTGLGSGSGTYGNYNAAEDIIPTLPQSYGGITSLVGALRRNTTVEGGCSTGLAECQDSYNAVTVLSTVPENAGSTVIRPNITGETKELISMSAFDWSRVPSKSYLTGTDATGLANIKSRWSHSTEMFGVWNTVGTDAGSLSEGGRAWRSHTLINAYGAGTAAVWYNDLMVLFSDDNTIEEKKPALAAMLAYGLDLYHTIYDPPAGLVRRWNTGATQHPGKFLPAVMLGALLTDTTKADVLKTAVDHVRDYPTQGPFEIAQIHPGANGPIWGDEPALSGTYFTGSYWGNLLVSQCYDLAPDRVMYDYYVLSAWKSFSLPIGTFETGTLHFTFWSLPNGSTGDFKIRNVAIDGTPINFNSVTLVNYNNATANGTIEDAGATYSIAAGQTVKKQTSETYTVGAGSILTFDLYQTAHGLSGAVGFEENTTYDATKRLIQVSGTVQQSNMFNKGCIAALGAKTMWDFHGYIDGPPNRPGTGYMGSSFSMEKGIAAAMCLMPEINSIVNYPEIIQYVDRVLSSGIKASPDPCVTPDTRENLTTCDPYRNTGCSYYGSTWGPVDKTSKTSACITTATPPYTKIGRFSDAGGVDGGSISTSYTSSQVEANWATIRAELGAPPPDPPIPPGLEGKRTIGGLWIKSIPNNN